MKLKQVSKKQAKRNRILSDIKKLLPKQCYFCGMHGNDLMHLLPKSIFPEYYCEEWNLIIGCREHHDIYDGDRDYRSKKNELFLIAINNVKECDRGRVLKYFGKL